MTLPEVAAFLGVDEQTALHLMTVHRVTRYGSRFDARAVRELRKALVLAGRLGA